jgi:predicted  nucleic acid-binding Zn-ribbon protein
MRLKKERPPIPATLEDAIQEIKDLQDRLLSANEKWADHAVTIHRLKSEIKELKMDKEILVSDAKGLCRACRNETWLRTWWFSTGATTRCSDCGETQ